MNISSRRVSKVCKTVGVADTTDRDSRTVGGTTEDTSILTGRISRQEAVTRGSEEDSSMSTIRSSGSVIKLFTSTNHIEI